MNLDQGLVSHPSSVPARATLQYDLEPAVFRIRSLFCGNYIKAFGQATPGQGVCREHPCSQVGMPASPFGVILLELGRCRKAGSRLSAASDGRLQDKAPKQSQTKTTSVLRSTELGFLGESCTLKWWRFPVAEEG